MPVTLTIANMDNGLYNLPVTTNSGMYKVVVPLTNGDLTDGVVGGTGTFDTLMAGIGAHLQVEFTKGRITGAEYTKAYIALAQTAMQTAMQYLLGRDQAYWAAQKAQLDTINGQVELKAMQVKYASDVYTYTQILPQQLSLATSNAASAAYQVNTLLPAQYAQAVAQTQETVSQRALIDTQRDTAIYNLSYMLPVQYQQGLNQANILAYQLSYLLPVQYEQGLSQANLTRAQLTLVNEQTEVQHAQTSSTRMDGTTTISGVVGQQVALYAQQITSYKRDAEVKAAKLFTDGWSIQKTMDSGLDAPTAFDNATINQVLVTLMGNNGFGTES